MAPQKVSKQVPTGSLSQPESTANQEPTPNGLLARQEMDKRAAIAIGENIQWLELHREQLLHAHPDWEGKFLAVASRTLSKVVAVSPERDIALHQGLRSQELLEQAAQEGLPPGHLMNVMFFGISWDS